MLSSVGVVLLILAGLTILYLLIGFVAAVATYRLSDVPAEWTDEKILRIVLGWGRLVLDAIGGIFARVGLRRSVVRHYVAQWVRELAEELGQDEDVKPESPQPPVDEDLPEEYRDTFVDDTVRDQDVQSVTKEDTLDKYLDE